MILIQRTKFGIFDRSKTKPKNAQHYTFYKDEYYTCGKSTHPIAIFFDILETARQEEGFRYLAKEEDGSYLLFIPPYEVPLRLESLDEEVLSRIALFSSGLETLNFDQTGIPKTDSKLIAKVVKKLPKVVSRYGFVYLGASIGIVYFLAYMVVNTAMGVVEEKLSEKNTLHMELKTQLFGLNTKLDELNKQLGNDGKGGGISLQLPKPYESFFSRASRGEKLEQDAVITTPPPPKEDI